MIQSKFKPLTILTINFCLGLLILLTASIFVFTGNVADDSAIAFAIILLFIFLMFVWLVWGEMRTKIIKIAIESDRISVRNYQGLGNKNVFFFSEVEGYKICVLPSEYKDYEYLYIFKNGQKIIKLSEFYHKNYPELKSEIAKKCKNLGREKFSVVQLFKELFS